MLQKIRLQNFRNLKDQVFEFSKDTTIIVGPNASGKTNLLESIYLTSTGKSFKAQKDFEMINENLPAGEAGKDFARVKALVDSGEKLEVLITKISHKKFLINAVAKRMSDFSGNLKVVLFAPEDLSLVTSSPSLRRKFLDNVLSISDRDYHRNILSYEKGLRARNKLLFRIREENVPRSQLLFWNQLLIKNADYISAMREELINFVNSTNSLVSNDYLLTYDKSAISDERLEKYAAAEIASATTLVGPHRDDFSFQFKSRNLASYGSRGEQRMGILSLKIAELDYIKEKTGNKPTLLLDDIFSELDIEHRKLVFEIAKDQQTIITTADPDFLVDNLDFQRIQF